MKKLISLSFLIVLKVASIAQNWTVNSFDISFKIKNAGITVDGKFNQFTGSIFFDPNNIVSAKMQGTVDIKSLDTGINLRNEHLQGEEYFDAAKHPSIFMTLNKLNKTNSGYLGVFILELKGVKKTIELPLIFAQQNNSASLSGTFKIDRRDFGVGGSSFILSDDVSISIQLKISHP